MLLMFATYILNTVLLQCHHTVFIPIHTQKTETVPSFLHEAKLLFFSVLLAFRQRNNHFCGCKGTYYLYTKQPFIRKNYNYLNFFISLC
jgi:hypothetical protein